MRKRTSNKKYFYLILLILIGIVAYKYSPVVEWYSPVVELNIENGYIGQGPFTIEITDRGKGIVSVKVELRDQYGYLTVYKQFFTNPVYQKEIQLTLDNEKLGLRDGPATLVVTAVDASRIKIFVGNKTVVKEEITLDFTKPEIVMFSPEPILSKGGTGLMIYSASDDVLSSGVRVGDREFPAYKGYFKDPNVYMCFFSHPYDTPNTVRGVIFAKDRAGNTTEIGLGYNLKNRSFRHSKINLSESFIRRKVFPLLANPSELSDLKSAFIEVNSEVRKQNDEFVRSNTSTSREIILWNGPFQQLSKSKVEAFFADDRSYYLKGEKIDRQYHLGYDLAVVKNYPVEAANRGEVVFTGNVGIYGNSIIIDHGFGVFTLYSHLSSMQVEKAKMVKKGEIIGHTGETGLAGGDHLHYGVYISGVAVHPVEWWDRSWVFRNVISLIEDAERQFEVAEGVIGFIPKRVKEQGH